MRNLMCFRNAYVLISQRSAGAAFRRIVSAAVHQVPRHTEINLYPFLRQYLNRLWSTPKGSIAKIHLVHQNRATVSDEYSLTKISCYIRKHLYDPPE